VVRKQQTRYAMFLKVRDFGKQHEKEFPDTSTAGQAFATVAAAIAAIEHQSSQRIVNREAGKKARAAARQVLWQRIHAIVRAARTAGSAAPPARDVFRLPDRRSDVALLDTAHAFITEGEAVSAQWVAFGLPPTSIADLRKAVDAFTQAVDSRRQGQSGVAAARQAVDEELDRGFVAVRQLDTIVAVTQPPDSAIAAAWKQARRRGPIARVEPKEPDAPPAPPSPPAKSSEPEANAPTPVAATDDGLKRAS